MKRLIGFVTAVICMAAMSACGEQDVLKNSQPDVPPDAPDDQQTIGEMYEAEMTGTVTNVWSSTCQIRTADGILYDVSLTDSSGQPCTVPSIGDQITVYYDGKIAESYPAQILSVYEIRVIGSGADAAKWGITLKAENVYDGGMTLICEQSGGEYSGKLQYGTEYRVEQLVDGRWQSVAPIIDNAGWYAVACTLPADSTEKLVIDWQWLYGSLPAGEYRIGKAFMDFRESGDYDRAMAYALFTIPEESPLDDIAELRTQYPALFDLPTQKGLVIYATTFGGGSYRYTLQMGKNLGYTMTELMSADFVHSDELKLILSTYDIADENIALSAYQHPVSSYLWLPTEEDMQQLAEELGIPDAKVFATPLLTPESPVSIKTPLSQLAYANHYQGTDLFLGALNADTAFISSVCHLPIFKMETLAELEQFKAGYCADLTIDSGYGEVPSFNAVTTPMDDAFFEAYTLLVIYVPANTGSLRFGVSSVDIREDRLCVQVEQLNHPEAVTMDMAGWFLTVPMEKSVAEDIAYFDAVLSNLP